MDAFGNVGQGVIAKQGYLGQIQGNPEKLTIQQNIQNRIDFHKKEILALEQALENITSKPLSEVTIGELNLAMRF